MMILSTNAAVLATYSTDELSAHIDNLNRPFACIYRPQVDTADSVLFLEGNIERYSSLADLTLDTFTSDSNTHQMSQLVLLPFNQLKEKGYACIDDHEQVIVMYIDKLAYYPVNQFMAVIANYDIKPKNLRFDFDDQEYSEIVDTVIRQEINAGEGSNFVISRSLEGDIDGFSIKYALNLFKRLMYSECGAYWTWMCYTGSRYFIGSTPEQHIKVSQQSVSMNPISGTLRYPDAQHLERALYDFLQDKKECDELFMVVDEELKMMSNICQRDIKVSGPKLKTMSYIAHTEYYINGESDRGLKEIIRQSLFSPAVTGSPIENACKVIARHEQRGRGYYSGVIAIIGNNSEKRYLDSAIMIRTADISSQGHFRLTAGSTIVRNSVPHNEAYETRAKLQGLMHSFFDVATISAGSPKTEISVELYRRANQLLAQRNEKASIFWLGKMEQNRIILPHNEIFLIDMEDTFTEMITYQLRKAGCTVTIVPWYDCPCKLPQTSNSIVFIGPGPGDPTNPKLEKVLVARQVIAQQLRFQYPLIGTCLGHQLICAELGIPIIRLPRNRQGSQYQVSIQGKNHCVGFYNSFSAIHHKSYWHSTTYNKTIHFERLVSNEIIALSSSNVASIQFHNESFLTQDAFTIYQWLIQNALRKTSTSEKIDVV
ncbi:putative phenazine biosynthesis protein PhzE [Xenorhabdus poinarii G6]|uniref:anthranilate synthase n=1 Tax=Xenorhabdus poinarii G6 TaxID=1354304 RepID=A0A068R4U9_9GAMM|nr:chorismate-binding protein [Xenorhabdus poinarii]CDG21946.1 putative phenazine biosynthesis protein PhzE [Xenorhabdus poinarii G6]